MRVLVVEDEVNLNEIICKKLTKEGYSVDSAYDGNYAIDILDYTNYDLVILDIMLPGSDGFAVLKSIRDKNKSTPVLFLTARDSIEDKVKGLDSGASDYLVKPFSFDELMARIRVLERINFNKDNIITVGNLSLNLNTKQVKRDNKEIYLTQKEYALFKYLMLNKGIILSKEDIENHVWNYDYEGGSNIVDVYINYLRKKIDDGYNEKLIHTYRGVGYSIREDK